jgi:hypothetical protein
MQLRFTTGLDHLDPAQRGAAHGRVFAEFAVELRLKGLPVTTWCEYLQHRIASLAKQFDRQEDVDVWAKALIEAYRNAIDNDMPTLMLQAHQTGREH